MRGKTIIRCNGCGVGSDKKIILVYRGIQKCQNCAAMEAMESIAEMKVPVMMKKIPGELGSVQIGPSPNILDDSNDDS